MIERSYLIVGQSNILKNQRGVIAKKDYKKGELLFNVKGPISKHKTKYSFPIDLKLNIDPRLNNGKENFGHYTNHSCIPNAFIRVIEKVNNEAYIEVIARKDIKKGDEVVTDYASFEYETSIDGLKCDCGQKKCRGRIFGFKDLPDSLKKKYEEEGIIPSYLIKLYNKLYNKKKYAQTASR